MQATVQQQTMDVSHQDEPHWEAGKVKVDPITGETRINDYGRPKIANPKGKRTTGGVMSDPDTSQRKRELLYRRANGKKILDGYLRKVAALFPTAGQEDLVSLEATDAVLSEFGEHRLTLRSRRRRISPLAIRLVLSMISKTYHDGFYVLIDEDWRYCGALRVNDPRSINRSFLFGEAILDDLVFISPGMERAISLDFFEMNGAALIDIVEWRR